MRLPSWTLAGGRFQLRLFNFSPARSRLRPALHRRLLVRLTAPNGLIFFDLFSTPLGRSLKGLAPHCNKCQFSTRFQRADDRSTPAENSGPGARASDPVLVFELQDLRRSYCISKYVPSRAVVRMKLREPGAAMLLRPTERERKHDWDGNSKHRRRVVKIRSCGRLMPQRLSAA